MQDLHCQAGKALGLSAEDKLHRALCFFHPGTIPHLAVQAKPAPGELRLGFPWLGAPWPARGFCKARAPRQARGCLLLGRGAAGEGSWVQGTRGMG